MINGKTVCLNMIVRNESVVIKRCLASVRNIIDYWVIVDTGSVDGTQQLIQDFSRDIPGELHERSWINFSHNRNEALNLARNQADYILFNDADDQFVIADSLFQEHLEHDYYLIRRDGCGVIHHRILMINNHPGWVWQGVVHECLSNGSKLTGKILEGIVCRVSASGGRRSFDPDKDLRDAQLLEQELIKNPSDARTVFYLGQCYRSAGKRKEALKYYEQRALMPANKSEEIFWSLYLSGCIQQDLLMDSERFINSLCNAHLENPARAEPLYRLANYFNQIANYILAYLLAKRAAAISIPAFYAAIESSVYDYGAAYELVRSAFRLGYYDEVRSVGNKLLLTKNLPQGHRKTISNMLC